MATEIKVPAVGESVHEGTLARWFKQDGDTVNRDEPIVELETDKATTEVPAPASGTLRIAAKEGQTVKVGEVLGRIEEDGKAGKKRPEKKSAPPIVKEKPQAAKPLAPSVRELVREHQVNVEQLAGSGPGGRITREDVLHHVEKQAEPEESPPAAKAQPETEATPAPVASGPRRQRMSAIRQRIAERLVSAQKTTATLTTFNEADLSAVLEWRQRNREAFKKKHGVDLGFMPFFVKAAVEALQEFPIVNASIDGSDIVYHDEYHIGVAVSTDKGLIVPVLHRADHLSFADIEKRIAELAEKARGGKIGVDDLQGGTFTITNGGVFGSLLSTPILNPPQSAILGMHTIQKRPVARDDQVVIRPMMYLALSYDHRIIDGREAVRFLVRIKECIESPERIILVT